MYIINIYIYKQSLSDSYGHNEGSIRWLMVLLGWRSPEPTVDIQVAARIDRTEDASSYHVLVSLKKKKHIASLIVMYHFV